eukprot:GSMAST32.ASY1.ANO1.695.1 assembled CDS
MASIPEIRKAHLDNTINFKKGSPAPNHLAMALQIINKSAVSALTSQINLETPDAATTILGYSSYLKKTDKAGFRIALSKFINSFNFHECDEQVAPDELYIIPGASFGIDFLLRFAVKTFVFPTNTSPKVGGGLNSHTSELCPIVFVEDPTYFLVEKILRNFPGIRIESIECDNEGVCVELLEKRLLELGENNCVQCIYTIPIHHNPTGVTMSIYRRKKLIHLSKRFKFSIIADEVYQFLSFDSFFQVEKNYTENKTCKEIPPPFALLDYEPYSVFSLGSFSKILSPGIRLGWIQTKSSEIGKSGEIGYEASGGLMCGFISSLCEIALSNGDIRRHITFVSQYLQRNCDTLCDTLKNEAVQAEIPEHVITFTPPRGGYFLWVGLKLCKENDIEKIFKESNVKCLPNVAPNEFPIGTPLIYIRLSFAWLSRENIMIGAKRLIKVIKKHI